MFCFRVDSSKEIGSGHLRRCLTLAKEIRRRGHESAFVMRNSSPSAFDLVEQEKFPLIRLRKTSTSPTSTWPLPREIATYRKWLGVDEARDAEETVKSLERAGFNTEWMIVDHYGVASDWEIVLRRFCPNIMVIDDLMLSPHECKILLNQNVLDTLMVHRGYQSLVNDSATLLLGPRYALIDSVYRELRMKGKSKERGARRVLVYYGSGDLTNETLKALKAIRAAQVEVVVEAVLGSEVDVTGEIRQIASELKNCTIHKNLPHLGELMLEADFSLGAGGTTSLERYCLGLPALVTSIADNQNEMADSAHKLGLIRFLGRSHDVTAEFLTEEIEHICRDAEALHEMSHRGASLVDGCGAERVVDLLCGESELMSDLRPVSSLDEDLLLTWANDSVVRSNAFNTDLIGPEDHKKWFAASLDSPDCRIWILEVNGRPAGQVRWNRLGSRATLDYSVAEGYRGKGFGKKMVAMSVRKVLSTWPGTSLHARVLRDNVSSLKALKALGFEEVSGGTKEGSISLEFHSH